MGDFRQNRGSRFGGGRPSFSGKKWGGGDRDRGPVTMHQATCDQCGKPCEVPFRPTEGKPVYCNVCFGAKKDAGSNRGGGGDRFPRRDFNSYQSPAKPDLGANNANKGNNDELKRRLDVVDSKLDRILKALTPEIPKAPAPEVKKELTAKKKAKAKKSKKS